MKSIKKRVSSFLVALQLINFIELEDNNEEIVKNEEVTMLNDEKLHQQAVQSHLEEGIAVMCILIYMYFLLHRS